MAGGKQLGLAASAPISRDVVVHAMPSESSLDQWRGELQKGEAPREVLANIREMAQKRIRNPQWARLYCELMGWVGTREQVINALVVNLGVSLDRAKEAVRMVMGATDDPHSIADECRKYLSWYDQQFPSGGGE